MIKIIRRCQISRLVEGFHPLFDESVVAPLVMPFLAYMGPFLVIFGVLEEGQCPTGTNWDIFAQIWPGSGKEWETRRLACTSKMSMYMQLL